MLLLFLTASYSDLQVAMPLDIRLWRYTVAPGGDEQSFMSFTHRAAEITGLEHEYFLWNLYGSDRELRFLDIVCIVDLNPKITVGQNWCV